jgi:hypothetical protein
MASPTTRQPTLKGDGESDITGNPADEYDLIKYAVACLVVILLCVSFIVGVNCCKGNLNYPS